MELNHSRFEYINGSTELLVKFYSSKELNSLPGVKIATTNNKQSVVHSTGETTLIPKSINSTHREDVNVQNVVVRDSLAVKNGVLYKPIGNAGWERVQ